MVRLDRCVEVCGYTSPSRDILNVGDHRPGLTQSNWSDKLVIMRTISATEFKAKCLAILDEVSQTGQPITILKRGKPIARIVPPVPHIGRYPQDALAGSVEIHGDMLEPVLPPEAWEAEAEDQT